MNSVNSRRTEFHLLFLHIEITLTPRNTVRRFYDSKRQPRCYRLDPSLRNSKVATIIYQQTEAIHMKTLLTVL